MAGTDPHLWCGRNWEVGAFPVAWLLSYSVTRHMKVGLLVGYCWMLSLFPKKMYLDGQERNSKEMKSIWKNPTITPNQKLHQIQGGRRKLWKMFFFFNQKNLFMKDSFDFVLSFFFFKFKMGLQFFKKRVCEYLKKFFKWSKAFWFCLINNDCLFGIY